MPPSKWTPPGKRIGPVRSYGDEQEGDEWAPVVIPAKAPTPAAPAAQPVDWMSGKPASESRTVNPASPPPGVGQVDPARAQAFVAERDAALEESKRLQAEFEAKKASEAKQPKPPVAAPAGQEQQTKASPDGFVDVSRGTLAAPPPTATQLAAGAKPAPEPGSSPLEDWRASLEPQMGQLADFEAGPVRPKPSSFVSFGDFAAQWDDSIRSGMAGAAQEAASAREAGRKAFSRALQQANERGVDVEATDAYGEFLREQKRSEELLGSGMSGAPKGGSLIEEALRGIYARQLEPLGESVRLQREGAMKTASQRNRNRVADKGGTVKEAPAVGPAVPPPTTQASTAETPEETAMLDADAQDFAASFAEANGRGPTHDEFAARRKELLTVNREQREREAKVNRAMPGKL